MQRTLEDIHQFCDEASALVRAGLPLDGISSSKRVSNAKLGEIIEEVQRQSAAGNSLSEIIDSVRPGPERLVTASMAAGLASGRLEQSLEMLGDVTTDVLEIRHRIKSALIYPLLIMVVAAGLFAFFIRHFLVAIASAMQEPFATLSPFLQTLLEWDQQFWWWPLGFPITIVLLMILPALFRPAGIISLRGPEKLVLLIPGVRSVLTSLQFYHASRVLSLLIDHNVQLSDALVISGACSERSGLNQAFRKAAADLDNVAPKSVGNQQMWKSGQLPPLIAVALKDSNGSEQRLKRSLAGVMSHYQRRLDTGLVILQQYVPVGLTVFLAGTTVLLYTVSVFWPMVEFYTSIVRESHLDIQ